MNEQQWLKAQCPVCRRTYGYPRGEWKPKTCSGFDCSFKYHHFPERYKTMMEHFDECRKDAQL